MSADAAQSRELEAARGWTWIAQGFDLFKKAPANWIASFLLWCVLYLIASVLPGGSLITALFGEVLIAGWMLGCRSLDTGGELKVDHLFAAFKSEQLAQLVIVGALYLGGVFLVIFGIGILVGGSMLSLFWGKPSPDALEVSIGFIIAVLLIVALMVPLMMATWFAPALVIFDRQPAIDAMKLSFAACMKNVVPFLVYGAAALGLLIAAIFTLGLAFLVLGPVFLASIYTSYRDVFGRFPEAAPAVAGF